MASLLFGLVAALCWGLHDFLVRKVSQTAPATTLLVLVLLFGTLFLAPFAMIESHPAGAMRGMGFAIGSGAAFVMASLGLYRAFAIGPVGLVAPICGAYPLGSLALAMAGGRTVSGSEWLAVLLVVAGIALVAGQGGSHGAAAAGGRRQAILWALMGAAGFALTFHLGQTAARVMGELGATLITRIVALVLVSAALVVQRQSLAPALPKWPVLALMGALDVAALGLVLASGGLTHPEYAAVSSSLFGVVTILLAWRFLGERLGPVQGAGVAVVFAGIALLGAG